MSPPRRPGQGDRSLEEALRAYLADQGWSAVGALAAVEGCWEEVVGPDVAAHVWPLRLDGEVLVVAVDQQSWAAELAFLGPELVKRLASRLGGSAPRRLQPTVRRTRGLE